MSSSTRMTTPPESQPAWRLIRFGSPTSAIYATSSAWGARWSQQQQPESPKPARLAHASRRRPRISRSVVKTTGDIPRSPNDATEYASEDQLVDRAEQVPIRQPHVSRGVEHGCLANLGGTVSNGVDLELKPLTPRYLHLGREAQETVGFEALHPPEIDGVPDAQVDGISPATAQPDATPKRVDQPTGLPERVRPG